MGVHLKLFHKCELIGSSSSSGMQIGLMKRPEWIENETKECEYHFEMKSWSKIYRFIRWIDLGVS
jgi:hypothetical protein